MFQRKQITTALGLCALTLSANAVHALTISTFTLPEGNTILQVTDAVANNNPGGQATAETRTLYVFEPDFGDLSNADPSDDGPDFPTETGGAWPWVYALDADRVSAADLVIDPAITADITLLTNPASGAELQWLFVNGNPTYQFINDNGPTDANGNFGPWNYLTLDGTPTQSPVPVPAAVWFLGTGVMGLVGLGRARNAA